MSMMATQLRGVIAAVATPFDDADAIDEKALRMQLDRILENGAHGLMPVGGTGEFPHLSRAEKRKVIEIAARAARGKVPTIAGTSACSTKEALELTRDAREAGADAAILVPPYYFRLTDDAIYRFYQAIAEAKILPIVVYNNPLYTGNDMNPDLIVRLCRLPGVIGVKQSNADLGGLVEIIRHVGGTVSICTGIDSQFLSALVVGAKGIFSTAAAVIPREVVQVYDYTQAGRIDDARDLHLKLQALNRFLEYDPGYVAPAKEALTMLGLPHGTPRHPMPPLTETERAGVREALHALGLLSRAADDGVATTPRR